MFRTFETSELTTSDRCFPVSESECPLPYGTSFLHHSTEQRIPSNSRELPNLIEWLIRQHSELGSNECFHCIEYAWESVGNSKR